MSEASDWLNALAEDLGIAEEDRDVKDEDEQVIANYISSGLDLDHLRRLMLEPGILGEHSTGMALQNQLIESARERLTQEE